MRTYRIYTENVNRELVIEILRKEFENFTLFDGIGYWKGGKENSLVIEIIGEYEDVGRIIVISNKIKRVNEQQSVLITESETNAVFV